MTCPCKTAGNSLHPCCRYLGDGAPLDDCCVCHGPEPGHKPCLACGMDLRQLHGMGLRLKNKKRVAGFRFPGLKVGTKVKEVS